MPVASRQSQMTRRLVRSQISHSIAFLILEPSLLALTIDWPPPGGLFAALSSVHLKISSSLPAAFSWSYSGEPANSVSSASLVNRWRKASQFMSATARTGSQRKSSQ